MKRESIGYGERARIGMLLPSGNIAAETELAATVPHGVSVHVTRLPLNGSSEQELLGMTQGVEGAAMLLADTRPALIAFHCTAVSTWDPEMDAQISRRIRSSTGILATTTAQGIVRALRILNAKKVVLITPYIDEINEREVRFLSHCGVSVLSVRALGLATPASMYAVTPEQWRDLAVGARDDAADAYFISCTAIRTLPILAQAEQILGRPVITSNQILAWHALRLCGINDRLTDMGTLLTM